VFLLPLAVLNVYVLRMSGAPWRGQWMWTIDTVTGSTVLTAPLAAAFAAWIALGQARVRELTGSTLRGPRVPLRAATQAWCWCAGAYLLAACGAALVTAISTPGGPAPYWALAIGLVVLAVGALVGVLAIQVWPHPMATVLVGPALFVVGTFGPHPYATLLRQGPTTGSLAGIEYDSVFWTAQVLMLLGVCFALASAVLAWTRRSWLVGSAVAVISVLVLGTALQATDHRRLHASDERATACTGTSPVICLAPSDRRALRATAAAMEVELDELRSVGAVLPRRYEELLPGQVPPVTAGMISPVEGSKDLRRQIGLQNVATPAACPAWTDPSGPPPDGAFDGRDLIVDWLLVRTGGSGRASSREAALWLSHATDEDVVRWVRTTFDQLRTCDLDRMALPWTAQPAS
jgi:hypothetical protein